MKKPRRKNNTTIKSTLANPAAHHLSRELLISVCASIIIATVWIITLVFPSFGQSIQELGRYIRADSTQTNTGVPSTLKNQTQLIDGYLTKDTVYMDPVKGPLTKADLMDPNKTTDVQRFRALIQNQTTIRNSCQDSVSSENANCSFKDASGNMVSFQIPGGAQSVCELYQVPNCANGKSGVQQLMLSMGDIVRDSCDVTKILEVMSKAENVHAKSNYDAIKAKVPADGKPSPELAAQLKAADDNVKRSDSKIAELGKIKFDLCLAEKTANVSGLFPSANPNPTVCPEGITGATCSANRFNSFINTIITFFLSSLGTAAFIIMVIGGFMMMTATGNPDAAKKGQTYFTNALIGVVLVLISFAVVNIIRSIFY